MKITKHINELNRQLEPYTKLVEVSTVVDPT